MISEEPTNINIYPNPAKSELFIKHEYLINEISIINELGEIVLKKTDIKQKGLKLSLSCLPLS